MKIVVLDRYTLNPCDLDWDGIKKLGDLTVLDRVDHSPSVVIEAIGDAEIIYTEQDSAVPRGLERGAER